MNAQWPAKARDALVYLFQPLQDVDIYVEDLHDEVFYTELFKRIAPPKVRIARVFAEEGRDALLAKANRHDFEARKALFLIDGDFYWVRGEIQHDPARVYQLDAYCIENLILQEVSAVQILMEEAALTEDAARVALEFSDWLNETSKLLIDLFIKFAALNAVMPEERTVSLGLGPLLTCPRKGELPELDTAKVLKLANAIREKIVGAVGEKDALQLQGSIESRINQLTCVSDAISGKNYLLPLFEYHLWKFMKGKTRRTSLRIRLARHCSLARFSNLTDAIARQVRR